MNNFFVLLMYVAVRHDVYRIMLIPRETFARETHVRRLFRQLLSVVSRSVCKMKLKCVHLCVGVKNQMIE